MPAEKKKYKRGTFRGHRISFKPPGSVLPVIYVDAAMQKPKWSNNINEKELTEDMRIIVPPSPHAAKELPIEQASIKGLISSQLWEWSPSDDLHTGRRCPFPESTKLWCWWDMHPFSCTPFPLPYAMGVSGDDRDKRYRFSAVGVFCGPSCAKAYAINNGMGTAYGSYVRISAYISMAAVRYGYSAAVTPAPPRELLKEFSGDKGIDIEAFREYCQTGSVIQIFHPIFTTREQCLLAEAANQVVMSKDHIMHLMSPEDMDQNRWKTMKRKIYPGRNCRVIAEIME
jgi:hypothetical protein